MTGTALLDEKGQYKLTLKYDENKLLRILQQRTTGDFPFTIAIKLKSNSQDKDWISFTAYNIKVKTKVRYDNKFIFNTDIKMRVGITERLFRSIQERMQQNYKRRSKLSWKLISNN